MTRTTLMLCIALAVATALSNAQVPTHMPAPAHHKPPPLSEEERAKLAERVEKEWAALPLEAKLRLMKLNRALREMPPEERRFIHDRVEKFLMMSAEERAMLRRNKQRWEQMTPEERQRARELFERRRKEFEAKWREEHPGEPVPPFPPPRPGRAPHKAGAAPHEAETNAATQPSASPPVSTTETNQARETLPPNP